MNAVLEIKGLNKSFGKKHIIKDVSFSVMPGEVFGFLGPNGAGKTTVIKMIMGFLFPDSGNIIINGYDTKKHYEKAMEKVGGIVENPEMYRDVSGRKNIEMYANLHSKISKERIDEAVKLVGMENRIEEKVKKYSLGMKQRVGLAQALVCSPNLLILDEPTNGLDPAGIKELRDILKKLAHEENVAVMVSSHMLAEMELMCDRVGIIENGSIKGIMTIDELLHKVSGEESYIFEVGDPECAIRLISEDFPDCIRSTDGSKIEIAVGRDKLPEINRILVSGGAELFCVTASSNSLEDAFIDITGGGNIIE